MTICPNWPTRRLKFLATLNDEALTEDTEPHYELLYIDIGNVDSLGRIHDIAPYRFEAAPSRARRRVADGDVIISTVRTYLEAIAPITEPPENLVVSTGFAVVRPKMEKLDPGFCKYALRERRFMYEVVARSTGISYPAINASDLSDIALPMPPINIQRRVAAFLDAETERLDALVIEKQRLLELLAEKRRALIARAITRGLNSDTPRRDSGIPWLGKIPAHWDILRVAWLFRERDERCQPGLPLLEVSIHGGVRLREFSDMRIEQVAENLNSYKVARKGDISFNKMRMWQGAVGRAPCDGLVSPDYVVAEPVVSLSSEYYGLLFQTPALSAEAGKRSHGIVWDRLRLYWEEFRDISVPVPSLNEQSEIVEHITEETKKLDSLAGATERTIALLQERRSALISAAVTGPLTKEEIHAGA